MKEYTCKYCNATFEQPLLLARHVRSTHKRAKTREKRGVEKEKRSDQISRSIEAIGILKGLQASPNLSKGEKKLLQEVSERIEELLAYTQRGK
jgi:uncharacterized C2H2 Zn-finger protein